jgi:hypothetical protein
VYTPIETIGRDVLATIFSGMLVLTLLFLIWIFIIADESQRVYAQSANVSFHLERQNSSFALPAAVNTVLEESLHHAGTIVEVAGIIAGTSGIYIAYRKRRKKDVRYISERLVMYTKSGLEGNVVLEEIPSKDNAKKIEEQFGKVLAMLPEIKLKQIQTHKDFVELCKTFGLDPQTVIPKISNEIINMLHYVKPYFSSLLLQDINSAINERYIGNKIGKRYQFHLHSKDRLLKEIPTFPINTLEAFVELIISVGLEKEVSRVRFIFNIDAESRTESLEVHSIAEGIKTDLENLFIILKISLSRFFIFYSEAGAEEAVGGQQDLNLELFKTEFNANNVSILGLYSK